MVNMHLLKQRIKAVTLKGSSVTTKRWTFFVVLFVVLLVGISLIRDWNEIRSYPWQLNWPNLAKMAIFHTLALGTMFLAWHFTISRLVNQAFWRTDFRIYSLSMLARRIPLPIWYVGSRVHLYREEKVPASLVLTATFFEITLIAWSGILCYIIFSPWYTYTQGWPWWLMIGGTFFVSLAFIIRPALLIDLINRVLKITRRAPIQSNVTRRDLLVWLMLYLTTWILDGLGLYFAVAAFLSVPPPVTSIIGVSTVSALVALLTMFLPSGFGLKEITMGSLLSVWIPVSAGFILSITYRLLQTFVEAVWVIFGQKINDRTL